MRPTEAPTQLDWPELLDLAEALGVKVYRPDDHGHIVEVTKPPNQVETEQKENR